MAPASAQDPSFVKMQARNAHGAPPRKVPYGGLRWVERAAQGAGLTPGEQAPWQSYQTEDRAQEGGGLLLRSRQGRLRAAGVALKDRVGGAAFSPRGRSLPWAAPPAPPCSVAPVRVPPPVSAGRSWSRVLPCLCGSPNTRPQPARPARPGPAQPSPAQGRAGETWRRGGSGNLRPRERWQERGGEGQPVPGGTGLRDRRPPSWRLETLGCGGVPVGVGRVGERENRRGEECVVKTVPPSPRHDLYNFCGNRKVTSEGRADPSGVCVRGSRSPPKSPRCPFLAGADGVGWGFLPAIGEIRPQQHCLQAGGSLVFSPCTTPKAEAACEGAGPSRALVGREHKEAPAGDKARVGLQEGSPAGRREAAVHGEMEEQDHRWPIG